MTDFAMFTPEGNHLVARITTAGRDLAAADGPNNSTELAWNWCLRELEKLAAADGFEEAMDTAVRDAVYDYVI